MFVTFALLTAAILALWLHPGLARDVTSAAASATPQPSPARGAFRRYVWLVLFLGATGAALSAGIVQPLGLVWVAAFGAAVAAFARAGRGSVLRGTGIVGIVVLGMGLMAHQLPAFNNPRVIANLRLTPDALPYGLHLNFDKTVVGLFLLALIHTRLTQRAEWRSCLRTVAPVIAVTVGTLLLLSLAAGYVRFAPKFPAEAPLFLWANLCLTCVAEEAFFRGFLQRQLTLRWSAARHGAWAALALASVLFGLAHAAGGPVYVALSTLAGFGYGFAYHRTGCRIEASILTHFSVNALHFLFFTYPALAPT